MKKFIFSVFICFLFCHQQLYAQELKSEFLFDLELNLNPPQVVGPVLKGTRVIFLLQVRSLTGYMRLNS